jgi:hypothetical protein
MKNNADIDIEDVVHSLIIEHCYELNGKYVDYKKIDDFICSDSFLINISKDISIWADVDIYATFEKDSKHDYSLRISNIYNVEVKGIFLDK